MSLALFVALASGCAALLLIIGALPATPRVVFLQLESAMSAIVGQAKNFVAAPKDALGLDVDLAQFPSALTDIVWSTEDAGATITQAGLTASIVFSAAGTFTVTASGKDKNGAAVSGSTSVVVEQPVPLVTAIVVSEV